MVSLIVIRFCYTASSNTDALIKSSKTRSLDTECPLDKQWSCFNSTTKAYSCNQAAVSGRITCSDYGPRMEIGSYATYDDNTQVLSFSKCSNQAQINGCNRSKNNIQLSASHSSYWTQWLHVWSNQWVCWWLWSLSDLIWAQVYQLLQRQLWGTAVPICQALSNYCSFRLLFPKVLQTLSEVAESTEEQTMIRTSLVCTLCTQKRMRTALPWVSPSSRRCGFLMGVARKN